MWTEQTLLAGETKGNYSSDDDKAHVGIRAGPARIAVHYCSLLAVYL